jgi:hypothetical protein
MYTSLTVVSGFVWLVNKKVSNPFIQCDKRILITFGAKVKQQLAENLNK